MLIFLLSGIVLWVELFGHAESAPQIITAAIEKLATPAKTAAAEKPAPAPPLPQVFETPAGGIVPADLSPSEKSALAALPPPQPAIAVQEAVAAPPVALPPLTGGPNVANPALLEKTPDGFIPRISDTGLMPMRAYAGAVAGGNRPRIAIVVGGLGMSARATEAAINNLPREVTLAFVPYAVDVQRWVALARQKGHEVLLQVPMEPYDFPDSDPGQYTLRSSVGEEGNTKRLSWSLSRMTGYVGVTNLLGGRFLSESGSVEPMLTYLMRRGLLFFDNGTTNHSVAKDVGGRLGAPVVGASQAIDSIQASMEIDHRLADLEAEARAKGSAAGYGSSYPVTMERVLLWSRGLAGRGFVLAPVSAIVAPEKK
ncbi:hypothetical protein FHS83_001373 [Rhizomicrobium palustre]|uniref:Divergent polysaccharide deacetylase family protein n=1 Tax=Rhizomicrobium palustre TaxID=189966 RepID=A0A846MXV3_9PROT|nr:hypothetical protein [Rhizomicrobium palustre]